MYRRYCSTAVYEVYQETNSRCDGAFTDTTCVMGCSKPVSLLLMRMDPSGLTVKYVRARAF